MRYLLLMMGTLAAAGWLAWSWLASTPAEERATSSGTEAVHRTAPPSPARVTPTDSRAVERHVDDSPADSELAAFRTAEEWRGDAAISLLVVDRATGEPVPDMDFVAFSERPQIHMLLEGRTDSQGQALLEGLPEDVILIETARRPPHAPNLAAVWLRAGEFQNVTLELGPGGVVEGRVVDDVGQPLEGVEIAVINDPGVPGKKFGQYGYRTDSLTDSDGRYRVDALWSRPRGVWIVAGEARPERVIKINLRATRNALTPQHHSTYVNTGDHKQLPDLVIPRPGTLQGVVRDHRGRTIPGALVASRLSGRIVLRVGHRPDGEASLWALPGESDFSLQPGEVLTDANGRFELELDRPAHFLVRTPGGLTDALGYLPIPPPGRYSEPLDLQLSTQAVIYVDIGPLAQRRGRLSAQSPSHGEHFVAVRRPDNLFEVHLTRPLTAIHDLALEYEEHREDPPAGRAIVDLSASHSGDVVPVVLTPPNPYLLRCRIQLDGGLQGYWRIRACLAGPEASEDSCCGLGGNRDLSPNTDWSEPIELSVRLDEPYWVVIEERNTPEPRPPHWYGPFSPGPTRHSLPFRVPETAEENVSPLPEHPPAAKSPPDPGIRRRLVDDAPSARRHSTPIGQALRGLLGMNDVVDEEKETLLLRWSGDPPPADWWTAKLLTGDGELVDRTFFPTRGTSTTEVPLEATVARGAAWLEILNVNRAGHWHRVSLAALDSLADPIEMPPFHEVAVRVSGLAEKHAGTELRCEFVPLVTPPAEKGRLLRPGPDEWARGTESLHTYFGHFPSGRYELTVHGVLYASHPQVIEIADGPVEVTIPVHPVR